MAKEDYEGFWDSFAKEKISWIKPYKKVLDESNAPFYKWFVDGKLNVTYQCIDRHLKVKKTLKRLLYLRGIEEINRLSHI